MTNYFKHFAETKEQRALADECVRNGDAFMELKQYQRAIDEYIKAKPWACTPHLGDAYMKLKQFVPAAEAYSANGSWLDSGNAFLLAGDYAKAAAIYDREWVAHSKQILIFSRDSTHEKRLRHADALFRTGEVEKAAKLFHSAGYF